ncbi:MAG TPA: IPT/TIG domain-containing protein [Pantanalinema sp.]
MRRSRQWVFALCLFLLVGCLGAPLPHAGSPAPATSEAAAAVIRGRVELDAFGREVQAQAAEVAQAATVVLIDPATNRTVATATTDADGAFALYYGGFQPGSATYYLEAFKRLGSNRVGQRVARLRTAIAAQGDGWRSVTNSQPGPVRLGLSTTALCAIVSLKQALPAPQRPALSALLGSLAPGSPDVFSPIPNCTGPEFDGAREVVAAALARDLDPLGAIAYDTANARFLLNAGLGITSTSPLTGLMEGASVILEGSGFDPTPANNTVKFNGASAVVTAATPTRLTVSMRGLGAGTVTVQVGSTIYQGPPYTVSPFALNDGTRSIGVDNLYQYSPVTAGAGYLYANWSANPNATDYRLRIGKTPGAADVKAEVSVGAVTDYQATGLSLDGAWAGTTYYVSVTPVLATGNGTAVTSDGVQVAEAASWDGTTTSGVRNASDAGYSANFPAGSNKTQFYGNHYFETVSIPSNATVSVQPFGKADNITEAASMNDVRVRTPRDGWLGLYANTLTVSGAIDAAGRGYGGGPGLTASDSVATFGHGGIGGLSGNGGTEGAGLGGLGFGAAGGGGQGGGCLGDSNGGRGGYFGGAGAGANGGYGAVGPVVGGSGSDATGQGGITGSPTFPPVAALPYGGGSGGRVDNSPGSGGSGYGAGGGGGVGGCNTTYAGGGGAGGTGGGYSLGATRGLGWEPGVLAKAQDGLGGPAGRYLPSPDTTTDRSWVLGSGGAGGNPGVQMTTERTTGGGGGAGGGAIILKARTLTVSGRLIAVGAAGGGGAANNSPSGGGGGGGSGGTILMDAGTIDLSGVVSCLGGTGGGTGNPVAGGPGGDGGNGGASALTGGTVKVFYRSFIGAMPTLTTAGRVYAATY